MERLVAAAVILGICFWPASVAIGLGWWMGRLERRLDPQNADFDPVGWPRYLVLAAVLGVAGSLAYAAALTAILSSD